VFISLKQLLVILDLNSRSDGHRMGHRLYHAKKENVDEMRRTIDHYQTTTLGNETINVGEYFAWLRCEQTVNNHNLIVSKAIVQQISGSFL
jgi:hypothetical protein